MDISENHPDTDGYIFIRNDKNYAETKNYKWKPVEKMTIDFVAKKCPNQLLGITPYIIKENKTLYILFSGLQKCNIKKAGIQEMYHRFNLFTSISNSDTYVPVPFSPSTDPYAYLFWDENKNLSGSVVELKRIANTWELHKIRSDRIDDVKRKTYYGNYFIHAESIWMNYIDPLHVEYLSNPDKSNYFINDNNTQYKTIRGFNNFVKSDLIHKYACHTRCKWVIDLAAGKGQDLFKYIKCGISTIVMIDSDKMALAEIVSRKHTYITNKTLHRVSDIKVIEMDLTDKYKKNICSLRESRFNIPKQGVSLVVCNFAMHYVVPNKSKISNFCNLLNNILAPGGVFICTMFNGEKVFNLLHSSGRWDKYTNDTLMYSIKKMYTGNAFTGLNQKIGVLLPFSDGQYYTEYLVNTDLLRGRTRKKEYIYHK